MVARRSEGDGGSTNPSKTREQPDALESPIQLHLCGKIIGDDPVIRNVLRVRPILFLFGIAMEPSVCVKEGA